MTDTYVYLIREKDWGSDDYLTEQATSDESAGMFPEHKQFQDAVVELGARLVAGMALQSPHHGGVVQPGASGRQAEDAVYTDSPYADSSELITGFYAVETDDVEIAKKLAALVPTGGTIEWRKVFPIGG